MTRTYCSLDINSNLKHDLKDSVFQNIGLKSTKFTDNFSTERIAEIARISKHLNVAPHTPVRYCWEFCTKTFVESDNLADHISWLLSQIKVGKSINDAVSDDSTYCIRCYFGGTGYGSGPIFNTKLIQQLAFHGVELQICFYIENE
jgi:hypothetical protein